MAKNERLRRRNERLLKRVAAPELIKAKGTTRSRDAKGLRAALFEAEQQQAATSEILRVISSSPTDVQPVFDAIAHSAARLFDVRTTLILARGDRLEIGAMAGYDEKSVRQLHEVFPRPIDRETTAGRTVLDRAGQHIPDVDAPEIPEVLRRTSHATGVRALLSAPMLREGAAIGAILLTRATPGLFSEKQAALLQTFARQAVIAIENVRLFNETREALERQTATSEILRVISSTPTDARPVFEAIVESGLRVLPGTTMVITLVEGDAVRVVATGGYLSGELGLSVPAGRDSATGIAIADRRLVHLPDIEAPGVPALALQNGRRLGYRSMAVAPMLRKGRAIGAVSVLLRDVGGLPDKQLELLKTFADQAVIAIENVRLFNETKEALERQTATSNILRVISESPTDTQPVFEAIVASAVRLCAGSFGSMLRIDGETISLGAYCHPSPEAHKLVATRFPALLSEHSMVALAARTGTVVHSADTNSDPRGSQHAVPKAIGVRAQLTVPLVKDGKVVGVLNVARDTPGPFSDTQIEMLETFADQAVIAIENVRLFNETKEALEQQTAISEVLRVISGSPTDVKPVLDAVAARAAKICDAADARIFLAEGGIARHTAGFGNVPMPVELGGTIPLNRESVAGRAIVDRAPVHLKDMVAAPMDEYQLGHELQKRSGFRTILAVPLMREQMALGAILLRRMEVRPFTEQQIALLKTFADQAAIAIENVRLFNETKEALEQQTATAEILRVISSSPTDIQPVLDAVASTAARLCGASDAVIRRVDGDILRLVAKHGAIPADGEDRPIDRSSASGRAVVERRTIHIWDVMDDAELTFTREMARRHGFRTVLSTPLLREGQPIGTISIRRPEARPFSDSEIKLLKTFADQAVIAIENTRLFNETKEALDQQTATSEILGVISASPTDLAPVFDAILKRGLQLCEAHLGHLHLYDGKFYRTVAQRGATPEFAKYIAERGPYQPGEGSALRAVPSAEPLHVSDLKATPAYLAGKPNTVKFVELGGARTTLSVPLLKEGQVLGVLVIYRPEVRPFTEKQIALISLFANQAVIAIENVRLFKELQERTEALSKSVSQLTALGEVGQAISSTLELETVLKTIVAHAVQLTGLDGGSIYEYDERAEEFRLQAAENMAQDIAEDIRKAPTRKGDGALGRTAITREPMQVPDTLEESYQSRRKELLIRAGYRALLAVPLLREDHLLGGLLVNRKTPGPFAPEIVELLKTFATQSAMAIQNARLFREIADKGRQLEVASRHKSDFLASMSHELRTPLNAILGFNEMILGQVYGEVPADMQDPLTDIQTSGKHLLRLINNVLDLAKIEAGRMELSLADYSVHATVESVRSTLRPLAADKGLEFLATVPADVPLAHGDAGRITQCLMNLAGNSLKFTKAGKVEISVELKDSILVYRVTDTGIGIAPDKIETVFAEFKQSDATIASEYGGTGLGLSISRKFIEMHGGRIWVESELGKGSSFIFEIPLRVSGGAPA